MTQAKTMIYEVVTAGSPGDLTRIINDRIKSGWLPTGSVSIGTDTNVVTCCPPWGTGWLKHFGVQFTTVQRSPVYAQGLSMSSGPPPRRLIHRDNPNVFRRWEEALRRTPPACR